MPVGRRRQGVHIAFVEQATTNHLACTALEEHVIGHNDGSTTMLLEDAAHMLDEIELLVAGGGPEVVADDVLGFAPHFALVGDEGDAALLAEGWIGEDHFEVFARVGGEAIGNMDGGIQQGRVPTRPYPPPRLYHAGRGS